MKAQQHVTSIRLIQTCFESEFYPQLFSGKQTNDPAFRLIGQLVHHTQDEDYIYNIVKSGLPENYEDGGGDTLKQLRDNVRRTLEQGWHEEDRKEAMPTQAQTLISLVEQNKIDLFHTSDKRAIIVLDINGKKSASPLTSTIAKRYLGRLYYKAELKPIAQQSFKQALDILEAQALFDRPELEVYTRVAPYKDQVVFNLADDKGNVVVIDKDGYRITNDSPVIFMAAPGMLGLPIPQSTDRNILRELREFMGLEDINFPRILGFLINTLKPEGPYMCLLTEGEQGSGKSLLCEFCKALIDPSKALKLRMPDNERDLMIQAKDSHVLLFDNISSMKPIMSDALCTLATGGGFSTRRLYTDDEQQIFNECRPFIGNGITGIASRPDLLERSIAVKLRPMPKHQRKLEKDMRDQLKEMHPYILDKLFRIVSCALRNIDTIETPQAVRMADAAQWIVAGESETGFPPGTLLSSLIESQNDIVFESMAKNSLATALYSLAEEGPFDGFVGELFAKLDSRTKTRDRSFPATPAHLSGALDRLRPALEKIGLSVEFGPKVRNGRTIKIRLADKQAQGMGDEKEWPIEI